jgi:hypothetical protein
MKAIKAVKECKTMPTVPRFLRLLVSAGVMAWLPMAPLHAAPPSSSTPLILLPLQPDQCTAVEIGPDGAVRLTGNVYQAGKDPDVLALEIESLDDGAGASLPAESVQNDTAAGGGRYVANPKSLGARFETTTPGTYILAVRIRHPGEIFFQYGIDAPVSGKWKADGAENDWCWIPLQPVTLEAGIHTLSFDFQNSAKTGYAKMDVDRILVYPKAHQFKAQGKDSNLDDILAATDEGTGKSLTGSEADLPTAPFALPRGTGPEESLRGFATSGTVSFAPLDLDDGFEFLRLQVEAESAGGRIAWRFRAPPATEWQPCPLDADVTGAPTHRLEIGATITRGASTNTPVIKIARCTLRSDPSRLLTLENKHARFLFSKTTGDLLGIWQSDPGRWLTVYPQRRPLYRLFVLDPEKKEIRALESPWILDRAECAAGRAEFRYSTAEGKIGLTGTLTMDDSPLVRWAIQVRNDSPLDIRHVDVSVPYLSFSAPDGEPGLVMPSGLWGRGLGASMTFPGSAALGWMDYHDRKGGLSLTVRDPEWNMAKLAAPKTGRRPFAGFEAGQWYPIGTGSNHVFELALGVHPGDWHWTADRYREWLEERLDKPVHPAWLVDAHGWCSLPGESVLLFRKSSDFLPDAQWLGLPFGQYWANNVDEVNCGIHPFFDPRMGSAEAMRRDAAVLRRKGGHAGYYLCCYRWHPDFADGERLGLNYKKFLPPDLRIESKEWAMANATKAPNGSPRHSGAIECYETETATAMCPASEGWQEHLLYWMKEWAQTFSVDCAYFDGGGIHDYQCFDERHPHGRNSGLAPRGLAEIIKRTGDTGRKINPDFVTAMEGMSAVVGQYANINLSSSSPSADFGKEYLYTFPNRLVYRGDGNGCYQWTGLSRRDFLMSTFVFHRYDLGLRTDDYIYLKDILALRDRIADWMYHGRFMDDVGLAIPTPADPARRAPRAKWFRYDHDGDQGALITFDNPQEGALREPLSLAVNQAGQPSIGLAYSLDGEARIFKPRIENGRVILPVITNRLNGILLVNSLARERSLRLHAGQQLAKGPDGIRLWLDNLSATTRALSVRIEGLPAGTTGPAPLALALPAESATNLFLPLPTLRTLPERTWLTLTADEGGKPAGSTRVLLAPPLHNRGFELDENGDGSPDDWFNRNNYLYHEVVRFCHDIDPLSLVSKLDDTAGGEGKRSLRLDGKVDYVITDEREPGRKYLTPSPWGLGKRTWVKEVTQLAILKPDTAYTFSTRVKRQTQTTPYSIMLTEEAGQPVGRRTLLELKHKNTDPTGDWFDVHGNFTTAPGPAVRFLSLSGGVSNAPVWFDQVELTENDY